MRIKNWGKFQHYHHRRPPWIKFYVDNIEEFKDEGEVNDFFSLPDNAKLAIMLAWLLASHFNGNLPDKSADWMAKRLGISEFPLELLKNKGFIEDASNDASTSASNHASNVARAETEKSKRQSRDRRGKSLLPAEAGKKEEPYEPIPGLDPQELTPEEQAEIDKAVQRFVKGARGND